MEGVDGRKFVSGRIYDVVSEELSIWLSARFESTWKKKSSFKVGALVERLGD